MSTESYDELEEHKSNKSSDAVERIQSGFIHFKTHKYLYVLFLIPYGTIHFNIKHIPHPKMQKTVKLPCNSPSFSTTVVYIDLVPPVWLTKAFYTILLLYMFAKKDHLFPYT